MPTSKPKKKSSIPVHLKRARIATLAQLLGEERFSTVERAAAALQQSDPTLRRADTIRTVLRDQYPAWDEALQQAFRNDRARYFAGQSDIDAALADSASNNRATDREQNRRSAMEEGMQDDNIARGDDDTDTLVFDIPAAESNPPARHAPPGPPHRPRPQPQVNKTEQSSSSNDYGSQNQVGPEPFATTHNIHGQSLSDSLAVPTESFALVSSSLIRSSMEHPEQFGRYHNVIHKECELLDAVNEFVSYQM